MAEERESRGFFREGLAVWSSIVDGVMKGGEIQSAVRQGFRELGNAFGQMWPESVAVVEPGAVFNPLYSDIAKSREGYNAGPASPGLPSPSEIGSNASAVGPAAPDQGQERRETPSPSEIAGELRPSHTPPVRSLEHGREI